MAATKLRCLYKQSKQIIETEKKIFFLAVLPSKFPSALFWCLYFFKDFIYLFLDRGAGRKEKREININLWLPLVHPHLGTWPTTQACALTGNWTSNPLVHRLALNPLSHTSQGCFDIFRSCLWDSGYYLAPLRLSLPGY